MNKVALFVAHFDDGGVERNFTRLAAGLEALGVETHLLTGDPQHAYLQGLAEKVRILPVAGDRESALASYLNRERPGVVLTGKLSDDCAALAARTRSGADTRLVAAVGTLMSRRLAEQRLNLLKRIRDWRRIRRAYQGVDGVAAISPEVARDLRRRFRIQRVPMRVLPNPIVPPDVAARAAAPCAHPWLAQGEVPVILAVGRLRRVKDYPTLLRAFARLSRSRDARLLILGEGNERRRLESLAARLELSGRVGLIGFVADPFPYLARSRLLVLSSRREGLGNVLVEAMAVGTPVVATECAQAVHDLLRAGELGGLVPVGDDRALAEAIAATLDAPVDPGLLQRAVEPYRLAEAARAYLNFFRELGSTG